MSKKLTKKAKKVINENVLLAVAITSVLINLFFLIGVVIYASTSTFDEELYKNSYARYCDDYSELDLSDETVKVNGQDVSSKTIFDITCKNGEFAPYYNQAVEEYLRDLGY